MCLSLWYLYSPLIGVHYCFPPVPSDWVTPLVLKFEDLKP